MTCIFRERGKGRENGSSARDDTNEAATEVRIRDIGGRLE